MDEFGDNPDEYGNRVTVHRSMMTCKQPNKVRQYQSMLLAEWAVKHLNGNRTDNAADNLKVIAVHYPIRVIAKDNPTKVTEYFSVVGFILAIHWDYKVKEIAKISSIIRESLKYHSEVIYGGYIISMKTKE
jgi:hypothetical protein